MYDQENYRTDDEYSLFDDDNDQDEVQDMYLRFRRIVCKFLCLTSLLYINRVYRQFHIQ